MGEKQKTRADFIAEIREAHARIRSGLTTEELVAYEDALGDVAEDELCVTFIRPEDDRAEDADC